MVELTRYFIHFRDGSFTEIDPEGLEFLNLEAARAHAIEAAGELWANALIRKQHDLCDAVLEITDSSGERLALVPLNQSAA